MKHSYIGLFLSLCLVVFPCCTNKLKKDPFKLFVEQHGNDDFSIFNGTHLFLRGIQDDVLTIGGIVSVRQADTLRWTPVVLYYNTQETQVIRNTDSIQLIDSVLLTTIAKRFVELDLSSIRITDSDCVEIELNQSNCPCHLLVRMGNDSVFHAKSRECKWEHLSGHWYVTRL